MSEDLECAKCSKKIMNDDDLEYCFDCKKYYCLDCVRIVESDDCYSNYVKHYIYCPIDKKHHMNSRWM